MKQKQLLWFGSFVVVLLVLIGLMSSSTQTALMQSSPNYSQKSSESQSYQVTDGNRTETAVNVQGSTLLIPDGSFESDPSLWTVASTTSCTLSIYPWEPFTENPAYHGDQYFWGGGVCEEAEDVFVPRDNSASMTITIPPENPAISFWYWAERIDSDTFEDFAYVEAERIGFGTDTLWYYPLEIQNNTNGWIKETLDLSDYAGEEIILKFSILHGTSQFGGNMYIDFVEFGEPTAETWDIDPRNDNNFSYTTASGEKVTDLFVPAGAVDGDTVMSYKSATSPGFPLYPAGESPLGGSLTFQGTAFDLEAYDQFIYLPMVVNGSANSAPGQTAYQLDFTPPTATEETHSFQFEEPIRLKIYYDPNEITVPKDEIYLYYWTGDGWRDAAETCAEEKWIDPSGYLRNDDGTNFWFELHVCHFSRFGTIG